MRNVMNDLDLCLEVVWSTNCSVRVCHILHQWKHIRVYINLLYSVDHGLWTSWQQAGVHTPS